MAVRAAQAVRAKGLGLSQPGLRTETLPLKEGLCVVLEQQRGQGFTEMVFSSISGRQYELEVGKNLFLIKQSVTKDLRPSNASAP